jgi:hypothetical protein
MPSSGESLPKIHAAVALRLLHHQQVRRHLHHAQQAGIAPGRAAQRAHFFLGKIIALGTMTDVFHRMSERLCQTHCARLVALQQVVSHALRGFWPYAGQAAQRGNQVFQAGWRVHFNLINQPRKKRRNGVGRDG